MKGLVLLVVLSLAYTQAMFFKGHKEMNFFDDSPQNDYESDSKTQEEQQMRKKSLTIQLINNHVEFKIPLVVEGLRYNLTIDTGSSAFFIKGEQSLGNPPLKYQSNEDYKKNHALHTIQYMDGTVKFYEHRLKISFLNYSQILMPVLVSYESPLYFSNQDGLIGLSFAEQKAKQYSFLKILIQEGIIRNQIFGLNLNLIDPTRSFITFGSGDPVFYEGTLRNYTFTSQKAFAIDIKGVSFEDKKIIHLEWALLDSGTTCLTFSVKQQDYIFNTFNRGGNKCIWIPEGSDRTYQYDMLICRITNFQALPSIRFLIGSEIYSIEKEYYLQYCIQQGEYYFCDTYIQINKSSKGGGVVLGDSFMHRYYTLFNLDERKVGIAKNRENILMEHLLNRKDKSSFDPDDWQGLNYVIKTS